MHRLDFKLTSDLTQDDLRDRLNARLGGRESEFLGVYTLARFDNGAVIKIYQPGGGKEFEVEMAAGKDVSDQWLDDQTAGIQAVFSQTVD